MSLSFFKSYTGQKGHDLIQSATEALVSFDPVGASEAQINLMEQSLDTLGKRVSQLQREYGDANKLLQQAETLNNQRLHAAEDLSSDPAKEDSLNKLLSIIEAAQPELNDYRENAKEINDTLVALKSSYDVAATKLKNARHDLEHAQHSVERENARLEREAQRANDAMIAAGVHKGSDSLNIALNAMNKKAEALHDATEAAKLKADTLGPHDHESEDANIAAALAKASGAVSHPLSAAERLAALKVK